MRQIQVFQKEDFMFLSESLIKASVVLFFAACIVNTVGLVFPHGNIHKVPDDTKNVLCAALVTGAASASVRSLLKL